MNTNNGALYFGAGINLQQWRRDIDSMRRDILGLNQTVSQETKKMDTSFKNLSIGIAGYFSLGAVKSFVMELINVRGEFQKTEIAFTTMLGNADQAKVLMGQMVDLAAKTPFGLQDVSAGAKQLLAFQVPANEVVDVLTRMGNIAAGLGVPLSRINLVYGQVKAKGKLAGDDLRQFTEAGIPMVAELAKKFNKTTAEISTMVSAGKIGFKDVQDVLFSLTNEGGMFFNLMEKQSASLSGKIANLGDAWDQMLNKIGEGSEGILNNGIEGITYLVEHYQKVLEIIEGLVVAFGAYKAAVIVTSAAQALGNRTIQSEIALLSISEKMKLGRAMVTQRQAEAAAREATAELASTRAKYSALQVEVSSLSVKKQSAIQSALNAAAKSQEARVQLQNARMELSAIQSTGTARQISIAQKRVESAQNAVIATQETASIARKRALATATEFNAAKQNLENTAKAIGTAQGAAATATEVAQTAAKNANTIATARLTLATTLRTAVTRLATTAQALLNATMLDNPIVLVIAAAVALTYAYYRLRDTSTAASIAEKQLNDERQRSSKLIEELKTKTQELTSVINSDTSTKLQQLEAYKAMQKMYPDLLSKMDLETFKKLGSTEAQKKLNAEMDKFSTQNIQKNIDAAKKKIEEYTAKIEELNEKLKKRNGDSGIDLALLEIAKKNLEAQNINLEKYNNEYAQRLENEKLSSMSLAEQKKYWEAQVKSINQEISALEKSNAKKAEALDKVNNIHALVKTTSISLINWNINPLLSQLNRAQSEIQKINNAQNGAPVDKNKAYWEAQKKAASDANDAMDIKMVGSKAWDENKRKYKEAEEQLKKFDYTDKQLLKDQKERERERLRLEKGAEKSYLERSISNYDQKISLLEESLKRSSGDSVRLRFIDKYGKEKYSNEVKSVKAVQDELLALREKRAEREKLIEVKSFQDRNEEAERQWNNYYRMAEFYGKETAEAQYKDLFQGSQTFLDYLDKQEQALSELAAKGIISPQQRADLVFIGEKKRSLTGEETPFENWKRDIDNALKSLPSFVDQIDKLNEAENEIFNKEGKNTSLSLQANRYLKEQKRNILQQQKDTYSEFIKEQQSFEDRKLAIQQKYDNIRKELDENSSKYSENELLKILDKTYKAEAKDISAMSWEQFQKTDAYVKAFGDLEKIGPSTLKKIRDQFKAFLDSDAGKALNPQELKLYNDALKNLDAQISKNPFKALGDALDKYKTKRKELGEAQKKYGKDDDRFKDSQKETRLALAGIYEAAGAAASGVVGFASSLGGALGMLSEESQQALKDVEQLVDGISNAVAGYFSGNYGQMAGGIVQMVMSISSLVSGDNARERNIREWQRAVEELKTSYRELQRVIEKTAGEKSLYDNRKLITNLAEQQQRVRSMREEEANKKKSDKDKVSSYDQQIRDIDMQIQDLIENFKKSVTTVEFKELSQKIADAIVDGFAQGEDAAKSFDKVVDDVMRNAVKNALQIKILQPAMETFVDGLYSAIVFSQTKYKFDEDPSYYYFLIGILHSVVEGIRVLSITVGTTTINGGLIRTGIISSLDGSTYFDLERNKIKGNIEFEINSPAYQQILNHIQFGSRNILRHSDFKETTNYYNFWSYAINGTITNDNQTIKLVVNENKSGTATGLGVVVSGIDYSKLRDKLMTLSFKVKANTTKQLYPHVFSTSGIESVINKTTEDVGTAWQKLSITFRTNDVDYSDFNFYCFSDSFSAGETIWVDEPVLEWGNISSDWSPAPEDIQETLDTANNTANAAKIAAQNAQTSANTANALLADISSDNKLTPSEKSPLKIEWDTIQTERPIVLAQAGAYNLSTSDYDNAYNELSVYIDSSSIFEDMPSTTDVNGDYLRYVFSNYFTKKVALLKLISDKAKQLADQAQNTANQAGQAALNAQNGVDNLQTSMNDVKSKTDNFTSINGGLLMSNIISVGDNQLNQRAFLSGVTDAGGSSIRFGAGANYADKNSAPFRVRDDGKLFATDAEITGKITATSGSFTGTVYAQAGKFGDTTQGNDNTYFSISSKGLESINGWVAVGNFSGVGNDKKYAQLVADSSGSALLSIVNAKSDGIFHTGISLDVRNGTGGNVAIDIPNGDIRVQNKIGFSGKITPPTNSFKMEFVNGLFVGVTI